MSFWSKHPYIMKEMDKVEDTLVKAVKTRVKIIEEASLDLLNAGGKRIRPALTVICAHLGTYDEKKVIPLAAALELFHMATLIHDDIIDNAERRRGVETAQSKYGKDIAVYTGDYLFSKAFILASKADDGKKLGYLSKYIKSICEGEVAQYAMKHDTSATTMNYLKRTKYKTALLLAICCQIGGEAADCHKKVIQNVRKYGLNLGMAFQIRDDLLDIVGEEEKVGKQLGKDILEGIYTLPLIYTLQKSPFAKEALKILEKTAVTRKEAMEVIQIIKKTDGIAYTEDLEKKYYDKAKKCLEHVPYQQEVDILMELTLAMEKRIT
ncbi:MAG: polyprenyl synthetase family protein [Bacillota bacterium]